MSPAFPEWGLTPKQQFGQRLRELRDAADLKSMDVAQQIGISRDLASRAELGERWLKPDKAILWARATGLDEGGAEELAAFVVEMRDLEGRLRSEAQRPKLAQVLRSDLYASASRVRTFATTEIPFYLQSAEYARQDLGDVPGAAEVVAMRRADNEAVGAQGRYFEVLLAESALRFFPCDVRAMKGQLSDLQALIGAPGVELGIIPFGTRTAVPLRNTFSIFNEITIVESFAGAVDLTARDVGRYVSVMDRLWDAAVRGEAVRKFLTAAAKALPAS